VKSLLEYITGEGYWILKFNALLAAFFFMLTLGFIFATLYLRSIKIIRNQKIEKQKEILSDFITLYLFDETPPSEIEVERFKKANITTPLAEKVAIKVLLVFEENFKGHTNHMIKVLFDLWDLSRIVEADLNSGKWYRVARGIYVASELNLKRFGVVIERYLDAEKDEVRQQAMLYFIQLAANGPLDFLDRIQKPLTLWEQIYIEECLKSNYTGEIPNFAQWLNSELSSVQVFAIKMIGEYNLFENIHELIPFLFHSNENIKVEAIRSLGKLGYPDLGKHLKDSFVQETDAIKSFILKSIYKTGSLDDFLAFEKMIKKEDLQSRQVYFKLKQNREKELSHSWI
jgi:hypothetical protein